MSKEGIWVDPSKIKAERDLTRPTSVTEIWIFMEIGGYYLDFLYHVYHSISIDWIDSVEFELSLVKLAQGELSQNPNTLFTSTRALNLQKKVVDFTIYNDVSKVKLGGA